MRIVASLAFASVLVACGVSAAAARAFNGEEALRLAEEQLAFGPRFPGSEGHAAIQTWIGERLRDSGWQVERQEFSNAGVALANLAASRGESDGPRILLGAHYDTRPVADQDALDPSSPVPGANDAASGVAVLLELARVLPDDAYGCDVRLAFFDAEDSGRLPGWEWGMGSRLMANTLDEAPAAVVVVDMVGDRDLRLPRERTSTPGLVESIWASAREAGSPGFVDEAGPGVIDDHTAFLDLGYPAADIIDFSYPYWHTTQDTLDKISAESLAQVGRALQLWLEQTCTGGAPFAWDSEG
jgi:hypothetical protein